MATTANTAAGSSASTSAGPIDWGRRAAEALARTEIMVLATVDPDSGTWTSPVQFSTDGSPEHGQEFVVTFLSRPGTRHGHNIDRDPRVAVSIYSWPGPDGGNLGLQITGTAEATGEAAGGWQQYAIDASAVWCFDSRIDHVRHPVNSDENQ